MWRKGVSRRHKKGKERYGEKARWVRKEVEGRRRTSAAIPGQMPQAVERMESERKSKDALCGEFHGLGKFLDSIDDLLRAECVGSDEVGD